jgi:thymidylate synthase
MGIPTNPTSISLFGIQRLHQVQCRGKHMGMRYKKNNSYSFTANGVNDYYAGICDVLMEHGVVVSPKGKTTRELHPTSVLIDSPRKRLMSCHGRVLNLPFALAEAIQIITGQNDAQGLAFYNSGIIDIQGDGPRGTPHWELGVHRFNAGYGERLRHFDLTSVTVDQLDHVIQTLKLDPDSRQASIVLSHPLYDNYSVDTRDRACNVYAHPMIRDGALDWMQIIRSNDAVWGIPYNMVQWSHLQEWVAKSLDVPMGTLFIVQDSFHVYEDKYEECKNVSLFDIYQYAHAMPMEASEEVAKALMLAERNVRASMELPLNELSLTLGTYWTDVIQTLISYRAWKRRFDDMAFDLLPDNYELKSLMLRMYCHYRWSKNTAIYADLINSAHMELSTLGVPSREIRKWLGTE